MSEFKNGKMVCLIDDGEAVLQAIVRDSKDDKILVNWIPDGDDEPSDQTSWEPAANFRAVV